MFAETGMPVSAARYAAVYRGCGDNQVPSWWKIQKPRSQRERVQGVVFFFIPALPAGRSSVARKKAAEYVDRLLTSELLQTAADGFTGTSADGLDGQNPAAATKDDAAHSIVDDNEEKEPVVHTVASGGDDNNGDDADDNADHADDNGDDQEEDEEQEEEDEEQDGSIDAEGEADLGEESDLNAWAQRVLSVCRLL